MLPSEVMEIDPVRGGATRKVWEPAGSDLCLLHAVWRIALN